MTSLRAARRLTLLDGFSLGCAGAQLGISPMAVSHPQVRLAAQRAQKNAVAALLPARGYGIAAVDSTGCGLTLNEGLLRAAPV